MRLTAEETTLLEAFRRLPANAADELSALVQRLAAASPETRIDWSDEWSEEDLIDFMARSIDQVEANDESR